MYLKSMWRSDVMTAIHSAALLFALISAFHVRLTRAGAVGDEDFLINSLLDGYSTSARPPPAGKPTKVHIGFHLTSVVDVEERLQTMTVSGFLLATWNDPRLTWNESLWNDLDQVVIGANSIWKPDFALTDSVGDVFNGVYFTDYYGLSVSSSGNVSWMLQGSTSVRCDFELSLYPFDVQTCDLRYESFNYPTYLLHLFTETNEVDLEQYHESSEFSLVSTNASGETVSTTDGNYSDVVFSITLQRRTLYFTLNLILPCALLSILTCFTFLLPLSSDERAGLAITLLLAYSVFQLLVADYLPVNSLFSPLLTTFILSAQFINGASLVVTIFVMRTAEKGAVPVPPWINKFVLQKLGVFFGITRKEETLFERQSSTASSHIILESLHEGADNVGPADRATPEGEALLVLKKSLHKIKEMLEEKQHHKDLEEKWENVSKVFDISMFIVFSLITFSLYIICLAILPA